MGDLGAGKLAACARLAFRLASLCALLRWERVRWRGRGASDAAVVLGGAHVTIGRTEEWTRCQSLELLEQVLHVRENRKSKTLLCKVNTNC